MIQKLKLFEEGAQPKILCLGAHCDDIEIGCGGAIQKIINDFPNASFYWVVFSGDSTRKQEAGLSADCYLNPVKSKTIVFQDFRESFFPYVGVKVKDYFEILKTAFSPDLIFTHYSHDAHQDHKLISNLTWNTFRNNLIFEYEIPKFDGDLGNPNMYFPLTNDEVTVKIERLLKYFPSQKSRQWFDYETFKSLLRLRGIEANSSAKYAEAFYCRKSVF